MSVSRTTRRARAAEPADGPRPWTPGALRLTFALNAIAAVLLVLAWYGVAGEARLRDATPWANLSAIGLVLAAYGNVRLLLVARARIGVRQAALRRSRLAARRPQNTTDDRYVALAGGRLYHRPSCRLVAGKQAELVGTNSLAPCGWCKP
jgi:hypothetical protein